MGKKQKEKKEEASPPEATAVEPSEGPVPEPRQPKTVLYCAGALHSRSVSCTILTLTQCAHFHPNTVNSVPGSPNVRNG